MYTGMSLLYPTPPVVERGIALHKMIRLLVHGLGGEGYLTFMGNEFGHPEWLDFPREGNNSSYHYARRQWNLVDDQNLRYCQLNAFDAAMNKAETKHGWLSSDPGYVSRKHEDDKIIAFERGGHLFVFNFHTSKSFTDYKIGVWESGTYQVALETDSADYGGFSRIDATVKHHTFDEGYDGRRFSLNLYLPCRSAMVLVKM